MIRVLIANAYSSSNSGDGLLVDETVQLVRDAFGPSTELTLLASYPESFQHLGITVIRTKPGLRGYDAEYVQLLRSHFADFDLIVGVGGGYLRAGSCIELLKTALVTGPQLFQAAKSPSPSVYMPQSIGPARLGSKPILAHYLKQLNKVWVRDDRSLSEFASSGADRSPDLAILGMQRKLLEFDKVSPPVLTVRRHRGGVPEQVYSLRAKLGSIDSYVQSAVGGNDDTEAVQSLLPRKVLGAKDLLGDPPAARVVVAMRLHAALMAINAGHYVVHLSYERKGFGAFQDLGLGDYVFNVHDFNSDLVSKIARELATSEERRANYDRTISEALKRLGNSRNRVVESLRVAAGHRYVEPSR